MKSLLVLVPLLVARVAVAQAPIGSQFQVNTYTYGLQSGPVVAWAPTGEFLVLWHDNAGTRNVQGQLYASDGAALGVQFQVNSYTTGTQRYPSVAVGGAATFVVVWESSGSDNGDTDAFSIQGRLVSTGGVPLASQFLVNSSTPGNQTDPEVAVVSGDEFVAVWRSDESDAGDVLARRFSSDGSPVGPQFEVNTYTTSTQAFPGVAAGPFGDFAVTWTSYGSSDGDDSSFSVQAQRFTSAGAVDGVQFQVNQYTTGPQSEPGIAAGPDGDFVVVWGSAGSYYGDSSDASIQASRFASDGAPLGPPFVVNSYTTGPQSHAKVAYDTSGDFIIVWESLESESGDSSSIQGQRFAADGTSVLPQFHVNSYTPSLQLDPRIAVGPTGEFVVVWWGAGPNAGDLDFGIQGQLFAPPLFVDGFESGNTSAWSATSAFLEASP